ncbi:MAG: hypothetical protein R3B72_24855 [Polyangiaceae bacterium]
MTKPTENNEQSGFAFALADGSEPRAADPASELATANPIGDAWPVDLTRRLRVLLHTLPLDGMRRSDAIRDAELRHYDGLALALRVLDVVIDRLGLEAEADREVVTRVLRPVLSAMDDAAGLPESPERHERMLDKVLGGLRNDGEARRPFREEYTSVDGEGQAQRHALEFRLLFDAFHPSGRTVLRPSAEACNLYLRLLDLDVEDAQAAAEAVVESQLARGRFDEAVHSARQARIQSVRFRDKVLQILRDTRRDVDRVDWKVEAPRTLNESLAHLERRVAVERGILGAADERLEIMPDEEAGSRRAVAQVADLTRDCLLRHAELHEHLIGARNVFLDAQARQAFAPKPSRPLPDLAADVLEPLLRMPTTRADRVLDRGFPLFVGPRLPVLASLEGLVAWMLQPRRPQPRQEIPVEPIDAADLDAELRRYPPEVRAAAEALLDETGGEVRLSDLLSRARTSGASNAVLEVIALLALQGFSTEDRTTARVAAEPIEGGRLEDPLLYGDDLLLNTAGRVG